MHPNETSLSRRSFLAASAATIAGCALAGRSALADDAAGGAGEGRFAGLPMGVQSYTLRDRSFEKALAAIKNDLKLGYVEIWPNHLAGAGPTKVKALLQKYGITATGWGVVGFSKNDDSNRRIFDIAKELHIPHITCDPDPDSFESLDKLTAEYGITADIHDHGPGNRWGKIDTIWNAIKDHSKMIGLCNDTGHFIRAGEDPYRACELFKDRMHAMHLKDFKPTSNGGWKDCALGEGKLPLQKMIKWLLDNNFKGDLSLEYEGGNPVKVCEGDLLRIQNAVKGQKP